MKMKSVEGETLYKKAKAKIFLPGNIKSFVKEVRAPAGKGLSAKSIDEWLDSLADAIEKQTPGHDYRLVPLSATSFNFVWDGQTVIEAPAEAMEATSPSQYATEAAAASA